LTALDGHFNEELSRKRQQKIANWSKTVIFDKPPKEPVPSWINDMMVRTALSGGNVALTAFHFSLKFRKFGGKLCGNNKKQQNNEGNFHKSDHVKINRDDPGTI
jgi:hypothetical protein